MQQMSGPASADRAHTLDDSTGHLPALQPLESTAEVETQPLPAPPARARGLMVTMGKTAPSQVMLFDDHPLVIGRAPDCTLVVLDSTASSHHARIDFDRELNAFRLRDMGSTNGTFLNGRLVADEWLQPGDYVQIGQWTMIKVIG